REGLKPSPTRMQGRSLALVLLPALLLTAGCTAQVSGYENPIAHDYGPVEWRPLAEPVEQAFVAGPGYFAAVANDAKTTPEQFQQRLAALPEDARSGELTDIRLGLRPADDLPLEWDTGARAELAYAPEYNLISDPVSVEQPILASYDIDSLPRDGDWVSIDHPPNIEPGRAMMVRLIPGEGADADDLLYGVTTERAPYGGWMATVNGGDLNGSLLLRTRYERDVDLRAIVRNTIENARSGVREDVLFAAFYLGALASLAATMIAVRHTRSKRNV
ncbi:MAG: hypothetical protein M3173_08915, partial [Chloroflexota bacterium]|nr:hypothetical protein [Chloroflexota bacterium]